MVELSVVDWCIFAVVAVSTFISFYRGFVKEALSLLTLIAAMVISRLFGAQASTLLVGYIDIPSIRYAVAYAGLFFSVMIIGGIVNMLLGQVIRLAGLGGFDRTLGMVFGFSRGVLILVVIIAVLGRFGIAESSWWQESRFIPEFVALGDWLQMIGAENAEKMFEQVNGEPTRVSES